MDEKNKKIIVIAIIVIAIIILGLIFWRLNRDVAIEFTESEAVDTSSPTIVEIRSAESGRNVTNGDVADGKIVMTKTGDIVEIKFAMDPSVQGQTLDGAVIQMIAKSATPNVSGQPFEYVTGSSKLDGVALPDGIVGTGVTLQHSTAGQHVLSLRVRVAPASVFPVGSVVIDVELLSRAGATQLNIDTTQDARIVVTNDLTL